MTVASLALVVLAALVHATWNLLSKRAAAAGPTFVFAYSVVACVAYAPWATWLVVHGGVARGWSAVLVILASGLIHLGYSLALQRGYRVAEFSVVYPVARGSAPMLSTFGAVLVLGEALSGPRLLGLLAIVAGIGLVSTQGDLRAFRRPDRRTGALWGIATGGLIAGYTVVDAYAVKELGIAPVILDWLSNLLRLALLAPMVAHKPAQAREFMRGRWGLAVGVGLLSPLSYILVLWALTLGAPLSVVAPMREMSMMMGALMGMLLLREPISLARLIGCAAVIAGAVLLGASD